MIDEELIMAAQATAERAAQRSGVIIRPLTELAEFEACEQLYVDIWGRDDGPPVAANVLRVHSSTGSYVVGAYDGEELLGGCLGFWGAPDRPLLHSHIAGVSLAARGRELGSALKLHQRAYALARGVDLITWTYDPLIARNAHFNLTKLGGRAAKYKINYYGVMPDAINAGDETDRIVIHWELGSDRARTACDGLRQAQPTITSTRPEPPAMRPEPVEGSLIEIPSDIEGLRRTDPAAAAQWRLRVRDRLAGVVNDGGMIIDFDRQRGGYVATKGSTR